MNPPATLSVELTRRFEASADRVFDAWLDPKTIGRWLFATEAGEMIRVELNPVVGGTFVIVERRGGEDFEHRGEYLEIDRSQRLVFTFGVPKFSDLFTRVSVVIVALDQGCELTLTHEGVLVEYASRTEGGWGLILDSLARMLP